MKKRIVTASFLGSILFTILIIAGFNTASGPSSGSDINKPNLINSDNSALNTRANQTLQNVNKNLINDTPKEKILSYQIRQEKIGQEITVDFGAKASIQKYSIAETPNDPLVPQQWWVSALDAQNNAWEMPAPQKQTILAVVDTGFALNHEEFIGRLYSNNHESGATTNENPSDRNCTDQNIAIDMACNNIDDNVDGIVDNESGPTIYENPSLFNCTDLGLLLNKSCNRIDDDGNGYVDDVSGWDFVNGDPSAQAGQVREANNTNTYHGTMVAGIAAANANNAKGVAGVDWNTKLLFLQSIDDDGYGDSLTVSKAIKYAADQGADVINVSLGTSGPDTIILQAVEYAFDKGSIVVAAAGNDGCDCMIYPAKYDITLSVGASNSNSVKASFSSYGPTLDIMAPGQTITSSSYSSSNKTSAYATGSGTSFATPLVAGLLTKLKGQLPTANPTQLTALATELADKSINGNQHKTTQQGYGMINFTDSSQRTVNPKTFKQMYKVYPVSSGGVFYGTKKDSPVYTCDSSIQGTTPIYKSSKIQYFYTINPTDLRYAVGGGYTNALQFYGCVYMPHDVIESAKNIDLSTETANQSIKYLLSL